ncbi:MAG: FAD-dependent oxidoreductase [Clostridia bacterium]|nr:FAD-dependent oxidoreductase [Clostridia bacterium]
MEKINLIINGVPLTGEKGETILQIAKRGGIEIPTLCQSELVKNYGACGICVVEAKGSPKLMRACSTVAQDGMDIDTESERVVRSRRLALEFLMSDHDGDCRGPCNLNCPAGTDCQGYLKAIAEGDDARAVQIIKEKLPLPASIGRVCPHPCETACRRQYVEEPISIAQLKAFAADRVLAAGEKVAESAPSTGKKVAIAGGGPAGLTAAYFLALKGHDVTIYEGMPKAGGMLRYGIPEYRLPKAVLDSEIALIEKTGVKIKCGVRIGEDVTFDELRANNDAVIIAIGAWTSMSAGCGGEDLKGVYGGIDFLRSIVTGNPVDIGEKVVIMGGGNTAMDACRSAVRLGAKEVTVVYRRTEKEMPAEKIEIAEAKEEGVSFRFLVNPCELVGENGVLKSVKLQVMELGEPDAGGRRSPVPVEGKFEYIEADSFIQAIGQKVNVKGFEGVELNRRGIIAADEGNFLTNLEGVFAVGDATNKGASIAIAAIGEANKAATIVDAYLNGIELSYRKPYVSERKVEDIDFSDREKAPRCAIPQRPAEERRNDFKEVNLPLDEAVARAEAKRCLECGCHDYGECKLVDYSDRYLTDKPRFEGDKRSFSKDLSLKAVGRNNGKCILCGLCVRVCDEVVGAGILGLVGRGFTTVVKSEFNKEETISICAACGKCVELCPTGALKLM